MFAEKSGDDGKPDPAIMYGDIFADQDPAAGGRRPDRRLSTPNPCSLINLPALSRVPKQTIPASTRFHDPVRPDIVRRPFKLPPKLLRQLDASTS